MSSLGASEIVNVVVAILFAISEVLPFIRNTEANGVIDFIRIFCVYASIKLSRIFGVHHPADETVEMPTNDNRPEVLEPRVESTANPLEFSCDFKQ